VEQLTHQQEQNVYTLHSTQLSKQPLSHSLCKILTSLSSPTAKGTEMVGCVDPSGNTTCNQYAVDQM
jgi:hypothetical protein